jgi:hypothetical protein
MAVIDGIRARVTDRMRLTDRRLDRRLALLSGPAEPDGGLVTAIGREFARGFNDTLNTYDPAAVSAHIGARDDDYFTPFYVEGAAMALAAARVLHPAEAARAHRALLTALPGQRHLIFAGWGWWFCVRPFGAAAIRRSALWRQDSLFAGLGVDGMAFATCFLQAAPPHFDVPCPFPESELQALWIQGHGRALWFAVNGHPDAFSHQHNRLTPRRRAELCAGFGLASAFAGMRRMVSLPDAPTDVDAERRAFFQGLAFGLTARREASPRTYQQFIDRLDPAGVGWVTAATDRCLKSPAPDTAKIDRGYLDWQHQIRGELEPPEVAS